MPRTKGLMLMDGSPFSDDFIPRVMGNGYRNSFNGPDTCEKLRTKQFSDRVVDAKARISRGEAIDEVRLVHGGIVVRTAMHELLPKSRMVA